MLQVTSDMDSDEYAQGGDIELYISAGLGTPLGCFFLVFTILNLFGELLGSFGRIFILEMDAIMGGLLGIPHYSKIEALMICGSFPTVVKEPCLLVTLHSRTSGCGSLYLNLFTYGINARQPLS